MRITNRYMTNSLVSSIQKNMSSLARSQEQLATSKRLLRPSDDPNVMSQFLAIKSTLSYIEQYNRNITDGLSYLDISDSSMGSIGDILAKASEYAIQAANGTYSDSDRDAVAEQVDKMIDMIVDLGNTSVGGRYIYAGTNNGAPPFKRDGDKITYEGDTGEVRREVLAGTNYRIDCPGINEDTGLPGDVPGVFGLALPAGTTYTVYDPGIPYPDIDGGGIFKVLFDLRDRLRDNDGANIQASIGDLERETDSLLGYRVQVGARTNHFETLQGMLLDQEIKLTENLNNIEGADMARLSIECSQQQLTYEAALASGSKMLQTSLLDFLR